MSEFFVTESTATLDTSNNEDVVVFQQSNQPESKCWFMRVKNHVKNHAVAYTLGLTSVVLGVWSYRRWYSQKHKN
jgi:hypothetical protein